MSLIRLHFLRVYYTKPLALAPDANAVFFFARVQLSNFQGFLGSCRLLQFATLGTNLIFGGMGTMGTMGTVETGDGGGSGKAANLCAS